MKVSLKLQDERSPILKAKIPVTIFSHPFVSSLATATTVDSTGESSQNPSFSLSTNFPSGPSLKFSYAPSETKSGPFSLRLKSGLGLFGSPRNSPLVFCAQFCSPASNPNSFNPAFFLHFKPQLGSFSIRKASSSNPRSESDSGLRNHIQSGSNSSSEFLSDFVPNGSSVWQDVKLEPSGSSNGSINGGDLKKDIESDPQRALVKKGSKKGEIFGGIGIAARTILPLTKKLVMNLGWSVNFPSELGQKMPYLTVNKIGIERIIEEVKEVEKTVAESNNGDVDLLKGMCFWMGKDLETLGRENKEMKQYLEEMKQDVSVGKFCKEIESNGRKVQSFQSPQSPSVEKSIDFEQWRKKKIGKDDNNGGKEVKKNGNGVSDVESELQKAIKAAST